ncbi:hypothetical protein NFI95_05285 [Acetobacteraceae bacterium KSS8]|uniref:Holin n=1 Tax=Endosaccharibacter trunci TaxID=2812733 RepID=A0ABT1W4Q2_9PROT|nr:hypothetical protein [Acetobacteraceae bacterium KSS8]
MTESVSVAPSSWSMAVRHLLDWSKQPSTQQGLSLLIGGVVLAFAHPFAAAEGIAATLIAASLPKLWPDNTTDAIRVGVLSNAIAHAAVTRKSTDIAAVAEDAVAILKPVGAAA